MHAAASPLHAAALPARMESAPASPRLRELTTALAQGDDAAWAEFHRDYGPALFRQLLAATRGDHALASEALQQAYLRIARHARPCDSVPMFSAWLRTVATSALRDCWRRRRTFWQLLQHPFAAPEPSPSDDSADTRLTAALDQALAQLAPAERALLEQKYFSGLDVRTLAERLDVSPKAVESRLTRARTELRRLLIAALKHHE